MSRLTWFIYGFVLSVSLAQLVNCFMVRRRADYDMPRGSALDRLLQEIESGHSDPYGEDLDNRVDMDYRYQSGMPFCLKLIS